VARRHEGECASDAEGEEALVVFDRRCDEDAGGCVAAIITSSGASGRT
jgi:hypothetical protein